MRTSPWDQIGKAEGGLRCSGHPINATQQDDVGTWKAEHGQVNKIVPLVPDLLPRSCDHPCAAEQALLACWLWCQALLGWGSLWSGLSPPLPPLPAGPQPTSGLGELSWEVSTAFISGLDFPGVTLLKLSPLGPVFCLGASLVQASERGMWRPLGSWPAILAPPV